MTNNTITITTNKSKEKGIKIYQGFVDSNEHTIRATTPDIVNVKDVRGDLLRYPGRRQNKSKNKNKNVKSRKNI